MSFFQNSVVVKYLKTLDSTIVNTAFDKLKGYFQNPELQENIRNLKEEEYQEGFIRDLFVNVLGYTLNPTPNYNFVLEKKNVSDSKKADGAISINDKIIGVVELKDTKTTDLGKVETQAFGYKNNQPDCIYIITSNFEKLRFYIDNAVEHLEFNLFTITQKEFELFYLCLAHENIEKNIAKKIKDESLCEQDIITKKLYRDYSLFKRELHQNLVALNPQTDSLTLFKNSQKLLDRFLFLFFAEDRQLLPPNSVRLILDDWRDLQERDENVPLYKRFKKYFEYLNTGFKGKRYDVFPYNGGLFKPDASIEELLIDNELLYKHTFNLSAYDFASEVDVNILGHIFENSLNELDELKAQIEGQEVDKTKTKRKKDGIFYTPKYITKYIVDNTVGRLCNDKKTELQINEEEYSTDKRIQKKTKQVLIEKLTAYRNWLLKITICDPACGSGAFLNQALDFLINEHRYIDELQAKLFGDELVLSDIEKTILENNLFGVDINDESVEIAKLSLWLHTAQPNRKLNDLSNNIKCGNSLIDDPAVAGDKAFNWQKEFQEIFANGGFDVVIGNPPYVVSKEFTNLEKEYLLNNYKSSLYQINLYLIFIELGLSITKEKSLCSYIVPNTWLINQTLKEFRKFIIEKYVIEEIVDLTKTKVFQDATVLPIIFKLKNELKNEYSVEIVNYLNQQFTKKNTIEKQSIINNDYFINYQISNIYNAILPLVEKETIILDNIAKISFGVKFYQVNKGVPKQSREIVENKKFSHLEKVNDSCKMVLEGRDIDKYKLNWGGNWIEYGIWLAEPRTTDMFEGERLLVRRIVDGTFRTMFINDNYCNNSLLHTVKITDNEYSSKFILSILNSKLMAFYFVNKFSRDEITFPEIRVSELKLLPIKKTNLSLQQPLIERADIMLSKNKELQELKTKFLKLITSKYPEIKQTNKLESWSELNFTEFSKELQKQKIKLGLAEQAEWMEYFENEKAKANTIQDEINKTDKEIDQMVYELYGLTEEEIGIVENSN